MASPPKVPKQVIEGLLSLKMVRQDLVHHHLEIDRRRQNDLDSLIGRLEDTDGDEWATGYVSSILSPIDVVVLDELVHQMKNENPYCTSEGNPEECVDRLNSLARYLEGLVK